MINFFNKNTKTNMKIYIILIALILGVSCNEPAPTKIENSSVIVSHNTCNYFVFSADDKFILFLDGIQQTDTYVANVRCDGKKESVNIRIVFENDSPITKNVSLQYYQEATIYIKRNKNHNLTAKIIAVTDLPGYVPLPTMFLVFKNMQLVR